MHKPNILLLSPRRNLQTITQLLSLIKLPRLSSRYEPWLSLEQCVHVLQRKLGSLRQYEPEENRVCEIADTEDNVVTPATNPFNGDVGHLADQRVECERGHCSDRNTFGTCLCIEDFGADNPGKWTNGCAEGEVIAPGHHDEPPASGVVVGGSRRELRNQDRRNDLYKLVKGRTGRRQGVTYKEDTVNQIANDLRPATTSLVNEQQTAELSNNSENRADALILESIVGGNTNLLENRSTKVLNSTDTRHLASGLDRARQEKATEA